VNDPKAGVVTSTVNVPSTRDASGGDVLALAAEPSGEAGDLSATPLANSNGWTAGSNTGGFSWSYPLRTPAAQAGPQPTLAVGYSSASADGRSDATNNQPSWLGEGFELGEGFIERRYVACGEDDEESEEKAKGKPNQPVGTGDQCWRSYNATMSLDGAGGELIPLNAGATKYRSRSETGYVIERLTGEDNGTKSEEYWKVTGPNGTQYFFGRSNLPGYSAKTNSAWTLPVYGNHPTEPCHAEEFKNSQCQQAWRWNLDYIVDVRGNTMSYWYDTESNKYSTRVTSTETLSYDRTYSEVL
jgi:hypothetical protein